MFKFYARFRRTSQIAQCSRGGTQVPSPTILLKEARGSPPRQHPWVLVYTRTLALFLSLALTLPSPALALRPLNAGTKESPVRAKLQAGLEEEKVLPWVKAWSENNVELAERFGAPSRRAVLEEIDRLFRKMTKDGIDFNDTLPVSLPPTIRASSTLNDLRENMAQLETTLRELWRRKSEGENPYSPLYFYSYRLPQQLQARNPAQLKTHTDLLLKLKPEIAPDWQKYPPLEFAKRCGEKIFPPRLLSYA